MEISCYIAPWALPREDIPVHVIWGPDLQCDIIEVRLPSGVMIKDFYNVDNYKLRDDCVTIHRLKSQGFFGFVIAMEELFEAVHLQRELTVTFLLAGRVVYSRTLKANFYRPRIEIVDSPESVVITDTVDPRRLVRITLKVLGFGRVHITTDINIGGGFQTRAEAFYRELVGRILTAFKDVQFEEDDRQGISIDPYWLEQQAQKYAEKLRRGEIPPDFSEQDLEDFGKWINDSANKDTVIEALSRQMENILIDSLLFYFDRFPADGVELRQGTPAMCIESATENVLIRFRYKDSLQNEYEPIELTIRVCDEREDRRKSIEMPINISWKLETIQPLKEAVCD